MNRKVKVGDLVWEAVAYGLNVDYHPAVISKILKKGAVEVIEMNLKNTKQTWYEFITAKEMINQFGFSQETLDKEHEKYQDIINQVKMDPETIYNQIKYITKNVLVCSKCSISDLCDSVFDCGLNDDGEEINWDKCLAKTIVETFNECNKKVGECLK